MPSGRQSHEVIRAQLRLRHAAFKRKPPKGTSELFINTQLLAELLQLSDLERRLVEFAALSDLHRRLRSVVNATVLNRTEELISALAIVLDCSANEIREALERNSTLLKTSLLCCRRNDFTQGMVLSASERLSEILSRVYQDENDLLQQFIEPASASNLTANDYPHLAEQIELLTQYLSSVIKS